MDKNYDSDQFLADLSKTETAKKATKKAQAAQKAVGNLNIWTLLKGALLGIVQALAWAPLRVTLFPLIDAWRKSRAPRRG